MQVGSEVDVINGKKYYVIYSTYGSWRFSFTPRGKKSWNKKIEFIKSKFGMMA